MNAAELVSASRATEELIVLLQAAEAERDAAMRERDEARKHLQDIVTMYTDGALYVDGQDALPFIDAIHHADIWLKGGL